MFTEAGYYDMMGESEPVWVQNNSVYGLMYWTAGNGWRVLDQEQEKKINFLGVNL